MNSITHITYVTSAQYYNYISSCIALFGPSVSGWPEQAYEVFKTFRTNRAYVKDTREYGLFELFGVDINHLTLKESSSSSSSYRETSQRTVK